MYSNAAVHSQPARHLNTSFHTNRQLFTEILRPDSETSGVPGTTIISKPLPKSVTRTGGKHSSCAMQWRSQKLSTGGASVCSIPFCPFPLSCPTKSAVQSKKRHVCRIRLETIEARLSLIDKNIGTSARFYA